MDNVTGKRGHQPSRGQKTKATTRNKSKRVPVAALASSCGYEPPDLSLALCSQCGCPPPAICISISSPCIACIPSLQSLLVGEPPRLLVHAASTTTPAALLTTLPDGGNRRYLTKGKRAQDGACLYRLRQSLRERQRTGGARGGARTTTSLLGKRHLRASRSL